MRLIFFGTGPFSVEVFKQVQAEHEVLAVVTPPDAPVGRKQILTPCELAEYATNFVVNKPQSLKGNTDFELWLGEQQPDVCVVSAYGKIIPENLLSVPPKGWVNVHPSFLPELRGASPIQGALMQGKTQTGTTIMLMDAEVDHGPIFAQQKVTIEPTDTYIELRDKLAKVSGPLLLGVLREIEAGTANPVPQDHERATFVKRIKKEDGLVDWSKTATEIHNQWRALVPWPGLWTNWNGQILKITKCEPKETSNTVIPQSLDNAMSVDIKEMKLARSSLGEGGQGFVGTVMDGGLVICGNNTILSLLEVQLEGKNPTDIKSFTNGHQEFLGSKLQ